MTTSIRIMSAEEITANAGGETTFLYLPQRSTVFAERSKRFHQLAQNHAMRDYLLFLADLTAAQDAVLQALETSTAAAEWKTILRDIVGRLQTPFTTDTPARLLHADAVWLDAQAAILLGDADTDTDTDGDDTVLDMAAAPFIAAALQVEKTHAVLAADFHPEARGDATVCPCCGSLPVASVVHSSKNQTPGLRYVVCSLCNTQWNLPRILCTHCGTEDKVSYQSLDLADGNVPAAVDNPPVRAAILAETCDHCGHYLKIMHHERDPQLDPVADDIASLALDLLVAETGMQKHGINLMLLFGE